MNFLLPQIIIICLAYVHGQSDKGNTMIPFPRIGRADTRFFMMEGKRTGGSPALSPGLIPFPRIGRSGEGGLMHEMKRQLIPFPRVGKRPFWHYPAEAYGLPSDFDDYGYENPAASQFMFGSMTPNLQTEALDETIETGTEKRNPGTTATSSSGTGGTNNGGLWFGPRLGKRRRRSIDGDSPAEGTDVGNHHESLDTRILFKILHNFNWAIVPLKERRTFTPRLGRGGGNSSPIDDISRRGEPYTPRLGRGKEISSSLDWENGENEVSPGSRFSRRGTGGTEDGASQNSQRPKAQSDESSSGSSNGGRGVPFSPRLGRDHINPRLGRSSSSLDHD